MELKGEDTIFKKLELMGSEGKIKGRVCNPEVKKLIDEIKFDYEGLELSNPSIYRSYSTREYIMKAAVAMYNKRAEWLELNKLTRSSVTAVEKRFLSCISIIQLSYIEAMLLNDIQG